jgi:hypothetical protein
MESSVAEALFSETICFDIDYRMPRFMGHHNILI